MWLLWPPSSARESAEWAEKVYGLGKEVLVYPTTSLGLIIGDCGGLWTFLKYFLIVHS